MKPQDEKPSYIKQAGIGAILGLVLFVTNAITSGRQLPPVGPELLVQMLGSALGGVIIYMVAYTIWLMIQKK